jgi:DNA-binding XRE family transcriptional regulator
MSEAQRKSGRPAHVPSTESRLLATVMSSCGFPQAQIAERIGVDAKTLRRAYREELNSGKITASAMVAQSLFRKATGTGPQSVTAAIFWLKTQAGWKETQVNEHTGADGAPLDWRGLLGLADAPGSGPKAH